MNYSFTLQVFDIDTTPGNCEDILYAAGCGDALIAVSCGVLYLEFEREAESFEAAVQSAKQDIQKAGGRIGMLLIRQREEETDAL